MNPLGAIVGAAGGFLTGGPVGAAIGGVQGLFGANGMPSITSTVGNASNVGEALSNTQYLSGLQALQMQQNGFNLALQQQSTAFNEMTDEKSELMREQNTLRDVAMEQRKADNSIMKEFIKSIG